MKKLFILIGFAVHVHFILNAQVKVSYNNKNKIDNLGKFQKSYQENRIQISEINTEELLKNEKTIKTRNETNVLETFRFAELVSINLNVAKEMSWTNDLEFDYGKLSIISKSAKSLSANFDRFYLPEGSELFIYNEKGNIIAGPITYLENNKLKTWASTVYKGGYFTLEIKIPRNRKGELELNISTMAFGYKEILFQLVGGFGQAGACNVNVVCPDGNGWEAERNSVGLALLSNGTTATTGSLLMNTCNTSNPYFLTADHSYLADQNISSWQFIFQAWSAACTPSQNSDGVTFYGASLVSHWNQSDFCLMKLNQSPPANSNIHFAGWNRSTTPATSGTCIHHPHGDVMKISKCNQQLYRVPIGVGGNSVDYWQANWNVGDVEPGSSGAPIFDQNHRVVGQASSGPGTTCAGPLRAYFGCIDLSWQGGGTPATRLKDWLDPTNSGAMTTNTTNVANLTIQATQGEYLSMSGNNVVCGNAETYTISNVQPGATVAWQLYGPDANGYQLPLQNVCTLTPNGTQATLTKINNGTVRLFATITNCAGVTQYAIKTVTFGVPELYYNAAYNPNSVYIPIEGTVTYFNSSSAYITVESSYNNTYVWEFNGGSSNANYYTSYPPNFGYIWWNTPIHTYDYMGFSVHTTNACGTRTDPMYFYYDGPNQYYRVAPNPVKSNFTITQIDVKRNAVPPGKKQLNVDLLKIQIVDKMGNIVMEKAYPAGTKSAIVNTSRLKSDLYTVRLFTKDKVESHKIIIQH